MIRTTKLYVPQSPAASVARPHLTQRLDQGLNGKLILVSAPAGFGKTTVVTEWIAHLKSMSGPAVAWLSLDEGDNDLARFLAYFIAALRTVKPAVGTEALGLLEATPIVAPEPVLTALLNDLISAVDSAEGAGEQRLILVLDDYHVIDSVQIDSAMALLLDELPARLHLVITTREDPALPLARLRARGQLTEVRAADLRFTSQEATAFLTDSMSLPISAADATRLEARTEGWIAGLQLAALSLRGRDDFEEFIDSFTGSHRFVLDYLVDEVLENQPAELKGFLLRTSILDRLTGPLCDAVTGDEDGQETLAALEHGNLFIVPLDDNRRWYRYHHLFADVLRAYARTEMAHELADLYRRAGAWHEQHGSVADAIGYALAAPDLEHAADLVEANSHEMRRSRQGPTLLKWIEALPPAAVANRPQLSVALAATMLDSGRLEAVEEHLSSAERWLESARDSTDDDTAAQLAGLIAMHRAGLALVSGDAAEAKRHAQTALEVAPGHDLAARGGATGLVGLSLWSSGELESAHDAFAAGMAMLRAGGFAADAIGGVATLADIKLAQGRLHEAIAALGDALVKSAALGTAKPRSADQHGGDPGSTDPGGGDPRGALGLHLSLADALYERNDLDGAERHLHAARTLGERSGWAQSRSRWCVAMALVRLAGGGLDEAAELVEQAGYFYSHEFAPNLRPVAAVRARVDLARGRLDAALAWADGLEILGADGIDPSALSYLREYEHITAARVLVAIYRRDREDATLALATDLLRALLSAAESGGHVRSVIEILVLLALARRAGGDVSEGLATLERAMALAEPEGFVRMFVDEGSALAELLRRLEGKLGNGRLKRFGRGVLTSSGAPPLEGRAIDALRPNRVDPGALMLDPLTERELEVLRLIAEGLSNGVIAQRLFRAESTIKGMNRVLFEKLQVQSRTEAIARARKLGLLG